MDPHSRHCSLIRNTPQASAPHFLTGALFHLQKGHPPKSMYFIFLPPTSMAAILTSSYESTLCPILPNHFILHANSLPRLALRAPPNLEAGFYPLPSQVELYLQQMKRYFHFRPKNLGYYVEGILENIF